MEFIGISVLLATVYGIGVHASRQLPPGALASLVQRWTDRPLPEWEQKALRERDEALRRQR